MQLPRIVFTFNDLVWWTMKEVSIFRLSIQIATEKTNKWSSSLEIINSIQCKVWTMAMGKCSLHLYCLQTWFVVDFKCKFDFDASTICYYSNVIGTHARTHIHTLASTHPWYCICIVRSIETRLKYINSICVTKKSPALPGWATSTLMKVILLNVIKFKLLDWYSQCIFIHNRPCESNFLFEVFGDHHSRKLFWAQIWFFFPLFTCKKSSLIGNQKPINFLYNQNSIHIYDHFYSIDKFFPYNFLQQQQQQTFKPYNFLIN